MHNSQNLSKTEASRLAAEIKQATSPVSSSEEDTSGSPLPDTSPNLPAWIKLGVPGLKRLALLRETASSIRWELNPHILTINSQNDGRIRIDLKDCTPSDGESLWEALANGKLAGLYAPFEQLDAPDNN